MNMRVPTTTEIQNGISDPHLDVACILAEFMWRHGGDVTCECPDDCDNGDAVCLYCRARAALRRVGIVLGSLKPGTARDLVEALISEHGGCK